MFFLKTGAIDLVHVIWLFIKEPIPIECLVNSKKDFFTTGTTYESMSYVKRPKDGHLFFIEE